MRIHRIQRIHKNTRNTKNTQRIHREYIENTWRCTREYMSEAPLCHPRSQANQSTETSFPLQFAGTPPGCHPAPRWISDSLEDLPLAFCCTFVSSPVARAGTRAPRWEPGDSHLCCGTTSTSRTTRVTSPGSEFAPVAARSSGFVQGAPPDGFQPAS